MRISAMQVPFLHRVVPRYLRLVNSSTFAFRADNCTDVVRAFGPDLALFCADFHFIRHCFVYESVGEVLKFTTAADLAGKW